MIEEICKYCNYCFEYRMWNPPWFCDNRCGARLSGAIEEAKKDPYLASKIKEFQKKR
mgnify:FL=1